MAKKPTKKATKKPVVKKPTVKKITDAVSYPYSITLPVAFNTLLATLKISHKVMNKQVVIQFENKTQLAACLKVLNKSEDAAASIITDGVIRSLKL